MDAGGIVRSCATDPGTGGGGATPGGGGSSGPTECTRSDGTAIPCSSGSGSWSPSHDCYLYPTEQPPADDPIWAELDGTPETGRIMSCQQFNGTSGAATVRVFVATGEGAPPDPAVLAQQALGAIQLTTPTVQLAPAPPAKSYVGLETWMWMPAGQWSMLTNTVTAGATSVTVTIEPRWVTWNMGPGSKVCYGAGQVWHVGQMPAGAKSSCSYTYSRVSDFQPGGVWPISAAITWRVNWTCAGNCLAPEGSLGEVDGPTGTSQLVVGERQSVNVLPGEGKNG